MNGAKCVLVGMACAVAAACGSDVAVVGPPGFTAPPTADVGTIDELAAVNLTAAADGVTFSWAQVAPASPVGTFSAPDAADSTWTAPEVIDVDTATFQLRLTISDGSNLTSGDVFVTVANVNDPPVIDHVFVSDYDAVVGETVTLQVVASDRDGDPFTITWSEDANQAIPGTLMDADQVTAMWRPGVLDAADSYLLTVAIDDGNGKDPTTQSFVIGARVPTYASYIQPVFDNNCVGCHGASGGLSLADGASHGNLVGTAVNAGGACDGVVANRVQATDLNNSALWLKITGQTACGTNRMPQGNPTFFDENPGLMEAIGSWILSGANND